MKGNRVLSQTSTNFRCASLRFHCGKVVTLQDHDVLVAAYTNDTKIIFPHFSASRPAGSEMNVWNGSLSSISRLLVHSGAQQRFGMTIQVESKQLYSLAKKTSSVFVRQKAKLRKSRTQKVGKSESEGPLAPSRTQTIFVQVIYSAALPGSQLAELGSKCARCRRYTGSEAVVRYIILHSCEGMML